MRGRYSRIVLYICVLFALLIFMLPVIHMVFSSFKPEAELTSSPPSLIPRTWSLDNLEVLTTTMPIFNYLKNSLIVGCLTTVFSTAISLYTAYLLTRFRMRGLSIFSRMLLLVYGLPDVVLGISYYQIYSRIGLLNTYPSLAIAHLTTALPICIWILWAYLRKIPIELDESALVDGASRFQILRKIIFPLALPGISAVLAFSFVESWNEYTLASMLMTSEAMKTLPVRIGTLATSEGAFWGLNMAICTVSIIPAFVFISLMFKPLIYGLTAGALKG